MADFPIPKSSTFSLFWIGLTARGGGYFGSGTISLDADNDSSSNDWLYYEDRFDSFLTYEFYNYPLIGNGSPKISFNNCS